MYQAVQDIKESHEALADLLEAIEHLLDHLQIYTKISPTRAMDEMILKIMMELLSTLALVTNQINQKQPSKSGFFTYMPLSIEHHAVEFARKLFGEKHVEAVLQRLDRLTADEARQTAAQTLEVVYGLAQNMRVVMDGEQTRSIFHPPAAEYPPTRWQGIYRRYPECPRFVFLGHNKFSTTLMGR